MPRHRCHCHRHSRRARSLHRLYYLSHHHSRRKGCRFRRPYAGNLHSVVIESAAVGVRENGRQSVENGRENE